MAIGCSSTPPRRSCCSVSQTGSRRRPCRRARRAGAGDVLESGPFHPRATDLAELTEEAPTLHLYVEDLVTECEHDEWLDPGFTEWCEAIEEVPNVRRPAP